MYDIIAVDDAPNIRALLSKVFRIKKWDSAVFESATTAMEALEDPGSYVLLTDINMPDMDGAVLARTVREKFPDLTIIAFTGSVVPTYLSSTDFNCVLSKPPSSLSDFAAVLADYLAMAKAKTSAGKDQ